MKAKGDRRRPSDEESIEATAAAWMAEQDGGLSTSQSAEFDRWRARDPRHEAAVQRIEATWRSLQQLRDFRPEAARHPDSDILKASLAQRPSRVVHRRFAVSTLAAALLLGGMLWPVVRERLGLVRPQHYVTSVNGYERVTLEDGSVLELNAESEASLRFTRTERRVQLVRGEAHFTVAKDAARPFTVSAGTVAVTAVGTAFNVKLAEQKVEVLVTEGRVAVAPGMGRVAVAPAAHVPVLPPAMVGAYERIVVEDAVAPAIEKMAVDSVRETLGWQRPRLIFVDTPLGDVVAQFNRQNGFELVVVDAELNSMPVGGSVRAENVEAFLRLLETGGDVLVDRSAPGRVLLRKAK